MANPEHLAILEKGVDAWNQWRRENPDIRPDLIGANLYGADLVMANLFGADFSVAHLGGANLSRANLSEANLFGATLSGVDLSMANLNRAGLVGANLRGAHLENAYAQYSQLCRCNLTNAALTGVKLYATARDDWIIEGVECRYIFWDAKGKIRSPKDRDFARGEFEEIYKTLPTIEYVFQHGMTPMDPLIMDRAVQVIRDQNPAFGIKIDSINARGLAPSIRFTVQQEEHREPALAEVTKVYEAKVHELAGRLDEARAFIQLLIDRPNSVYIENPTGPLAFGGSTINIVQHIHHAVELQKIIAEQAEDSETFAKVSKKTALDIIGSVLRDIAKWQVKEAAKQIYELGKDLGPAVVNTAAYAFFRNIPG